MMMLTLLPLLIGLIAILLVVVGGPGPFLPGLTLLAVLVPLLIGFLAFSVPGEMPMVAPAPVEPLPQSLPQPLPQSLPLPAGGPAPDAAVGV